MAIELVPEQGLAFLNFEDPDDMIRKQEEAEKALAAMNPPAAETAAIPTDNTTVAPTEFPQPAAELPPNSAIPTTPINTRIER